MSLKILLADDSMTAQNMGKKILTDAGYDVVAVSNGAAAVKKFAEQKPDLAILDIYMPGYTGLEVCERVKSTLESSRTPVLLTVGKMEPYRVEDGARVRADGVIVKPFEATDLLAAVEKLSSKVASAKPAPPAATEDPSEIETMSFQALKDETSENTGPERIAVPQEMQVSPAMDFAAIGIEPMQHEMVSAAELALHQPAPAPEIEITPAPEETPWQPAGFVLDEMAERSASVDRFDEPLFSLDGTGNAALEAMPANEPADGAAIVQPFDVEFNAVAPVENVDVETAQDLVAEVEPSSSADETAVDPALLSSVEAASEFPAAFGSEIVESTSDLHSQSESHELHESRVAAPTLSPVESSESADDFESRVAAAMAAYESQSPVPEPSSANVADTASWHAEPVAVDDSEAAVSLEAEMAAQEWPESFPSAPEFGPIPSVEAAPVTESSVIVAEARAPVAEPMPAVEAFTAPATVGAEPEPSFVQPPVISETEQDAGVISEPKPHAAEETSLAEAAPEPEDHAESAGELHNDLAMAAAAAAVGGAAEMAARSEAAKPETHVDEDRIAKAIQRVLERLKPQIVTEIARELTKDDE